MKKVHAPIAGLILLCSAVSCRKDVDERIAAQPQVSEVVASSSLNNSNGITESSWQKGDSWVSVQLPTHTIFHTNMAAASISAETAENGLVRIFKTSDDGKTTQSLPFEETVNGQKNYWYYQVTAGNIMVAVDVYGTATNPAAISSFKSVVLSKEAVATQETKGNSKEILMNLPVSAITQIK
ncbi:MAG TPA: hypothetical protein VHK91_06265 [Flavisolibacter sp.]|jgi:hypothetical protein|nr:hypothetical protein [Flavisolibacter sp.]